MIGIRNITVFVITAFAAFAVSPVAQAGGHVKFKDIKGAADAQSVLMNELVAFDQVAWGRGKSATPPKSDGPGGVIITTSNRKTSSAIKIRYPRQKKFASLTLLVKENGQQQTLILTGIKPKRFRNRRTPTKDGKIIQQEWTLTYETIQRAK